MESLELVPDIVLQSMKHGQSLGRLTASLFDQLDTVLSMMRPDWVLVQGDTTSAMVAATSAFYSDMRVAHVEAGLRTGDLQQPFPEEYNRLVISRIARENFAPTDRAAANLRQELVPEASIHVTGNTVVDALNWIAPRVEETAEPAVRSLVASFPPEARLLLVTMHRRESFGEGIRNTCAALRRLADSDDEVRIVLVTHLNPNMREPVHVLLGGHPRITLVEPVDYFSLLFLMKRAELVLTDSGGIQEEAPAFGKPVLILRNVTERPEAVEMGCAKIVGTDEDLIVRETILLLHDRTAYRAMVAERNPFGDGKASQRIADILRTHG